MIIAYDSNIKNDIVINDTTAKDVTVRDVTATKKHTFHLETVDTMYIFHITKFGHVEHIYYGEKLFAPDIDALLMKHTAQSGSTIAYDLSDSIYTLDNICLEWSGIGKGDYRYSPSELKMPDQGFVTDFIYENHSVTKGNLPAKTLPCAYSKEENCETLTLTLRDKACDVILTLYYTVYEQSNVITRRAVLRNLDERPLLIRRLLSLSLDMPNQGYKLITFDGDWIKEAHRHDRKLNYGMYVNQSTTGASSNKHNPGFLIAEENAMQEYGKVYGFNLIYSGNHFGFAELNSHDLVRIGIGMNPHCFEWLLNKEEEFETPEAVMTFSGKGFNGMSRNFHDFTNNHIIRGEWKNKERPVLYNSWEACFFRFTQKKLLKLARISKNLGIELFVLDDGWFEGRKNDSAGLGDYQPDKHKFPHGLKHFAKKIRKLGLGFGIWFEPEMVNENSSLYRMHKEYAISLPGRKPTYGRNQLVLDLCNPKVRDYIVEHVGKVLDDTQASYVKWDMNRHISEFWSESIGLSGEFFHRYILGLYDVLNKIFYKRPHVLLESCSSGGNRFDLGMLCFSPQIWASDNTDPATRINIQGGLSYLYPLSAIGAHVSDAPHQQTLRETPLSARFNTACFGSLGYELDLRYLSYVERLEIKEQISFYKSYRKTFQYGRFKRIDNIKPNKTTWLVIEPDTSTALAGFYQSLAGVSEGCDILKLPGLDKASRYRIITKSQSLFIKRFGGLVKHILPITLNPDGFILRIANRFYKLTDCVEEYILGGDTLSEGVMLNNQFMGSYYNNKTRLLGDFGGSLYLIERI